MGSSLRRNCFTVKTVSCICMMSLLVSFIQRVNSSALLQSTESDSYLSSAQTTNQLPIAENTSGDNGVINDFTLSPLPPDRPPTKVIKTRRRVVRRKKKPKVPQNISLISSMSSIGSGEGSFNSESIQMPTALAFSDEEYTHKAMTNVKSHPRKRGHVHKVPEVWKVSDVEAIKDSNIEKRESMEDITTRKNNVGQLIKSEENNAPDLHTEESSHPYINTSTPISNELQNSLQFTLQILHPLLNSDSVLSEKSSKIPENKTVELTHTLSDSVAQTPVAHDLGFLPTHLKKKHPLLDQDSIFTGESGASKTGIRINDDLYPVLQNTSRSSTKENTIISPPTPIPNIVTVTSSSTTTTTTAGSTTSIFIEPRITTTTIKPTTDAPSTLRPSSTSTSGMTTVTFPRIIDYVTPTKGVYSVPTIPTTVKSTTHYPSSSTTPSTTTFSFSDSQESIQTLLGILNITELNSGESSEEINVPNISPTNGAKSNEAFPTIIQNNSHEPPVVLFPVKGENHKTNEKPITDELSPNFSGIPSNENSGEVSSAEQMLVEQLLGITSNAVSNSTTTSGDSSEQLVNLFNNLVNSQVQNQGKQNPSQDANNLLQSILVNSLKPQNQQNFGNNPLLNLGDILAATTNGFSTPVNKITTTTPSSPVKSTEGLSDSDLKSIFALLDSQTPLKTTFATTKPTTTTTTRATTTTPTTTTTHRAPTLLTTTLHPALQSMLDLFNNQLKPFQSIPSSSPTFLQDLAPVKLTTSTTTPVPTTTTVSPITTVNSLDILSQLLNFGGGVNKINPVRSTPAPEISLASLFGGQQHNQLADAVARPTQAQTHQFNFANIFGKNGNIFPSNFPTVQESSAPSESNQLLNFFGQPTTPTPPNGLYYWLDLNAFLGGDPKADPLSGIRPKMGNKYPFIKIN